MNRALLLHGALGSSNQLTLLKELLGQEGAEVHLLNFSGHSGESFKPEFGIEQFAQDTIEFIQNNKLNDLTVFGYSMGGYVAIWLSLQHPKLFPSIITLGTKFDWSQESAEKEIRMMNPQKIEEKIPAFARLLESRHKPNDWKELMLKTADMMRALGNQPLLTLSNLKQIQAKVTIALGELDDMADHAYSKQVATTIPNAQFIFLKDTPHPIEKADHKFLVQLIINQ